MMPANPDIQKAAELAKAAIADFDHPDATSMSKFVALLTDEEPLSITLSRALLHLNEQVEKAAAQYRMLGRKYRSGRNKRKPESPQVYPEMLEERPMTPDYRCSYCRNLDKACWRCATAPLIRRFHAMLRRKS